MNNIAMEDRVLVGVRELAMEVHVLAGVTVVDLRMTSPWSHGGSYARSRPRACSDDLAMEGCVPAAVRFIDMESLHERPR